MGGGIIVKALVKGFGYKCRIAAAVSFGHQTRQRNHDHIRHLGNANSLYGGSFLHEYGLRNQVGGVDQIPQGTGDAFRTQGSIGA